MTFGWIGYVLALLGCGIVTGGFVAGALLLYAIGKRAETRGPRVSVEAVSSGDDDERAPGA